MCPMKGLHPNWKHWLGPYLLDMDRLSNLARADLKNALLGILSYRQQKAVDALAPTHLDGSQRFTGSH